MSDVNKIVAAILSTGRFSNTTTTVDSGARIKEYHEVLKALNDQEGQDEPTGPDINAVKTAVIDALDRVLAKK